MVMVYLIGRVLDQPCLGNHGGAAAISGVNMAPL